MFICKNPLRWLLISVVVAGASLHVLRAQDLPPCGERSHVVLSPWTDSSHWCLEEVLHDDSGVLTFTALAAGDDGTLYATRPLQGPRLDQRLSV